MENENKCCEKTDELQMPFAEEAIQSGLGLRFDTDNNLIAIGIITEGGNASLAISLEEAESFLENLTKVVEEARVFSKGYREDKAE